MQNDRKPCPECGNKMNYSAANKIYLCPYCGEEFGERNGKLVKKVAQASGPTGERSAAEMREELDAAFKETQIGAQLADEEAKKVRKREQTELFDLRMRNTEARTMIRATNRRGIGLCLFLDFVIFVLSYNYNLLVYGLIAMAFLTLGTYLYLTSYTAKIKEWQTRVASETKEIEGDVYLEGLNQELDKDEGPK
ncbi:MAG TPA: hypothetical protein VM163_03490 [bacterium]|nr:hypothetical protein [bacterium]